MELYNQEHIQNWYNEYAQQETFRWDKSIVEEVKYEVHLQILKDNINKDDKILELGSGTGMFTKEIAKIASNAIISDLSPVQLELNKNRAKEFGYIERIKSFELIDITDLSSFEDDSFDKIVCFGGPLSYVFEKKSVALSEFKRVLKPNGIALISVMNLWGTINEYLTSIIMEIPKDKNEKILNSGDLHPSSFAPSDHHCHMFRIDELKADIETSGLKVIDVSASNCLSSLRAKDLEEIKKDKGNWDYFLSMEKRACKSSGMLESGTHTVVVMKKTFANTVYSK